MAPQRHVCGNYSKWTISRKTDQDREGDLVVRIVGKIVDSHDGTIRIRGIDAQIKAFSGDGLIRSRLEKKNGWPLVRIHGDGDLVCCGGVEVINGTGSEGVGAGSEE